MCHIERQEGAIKLADRMINSNKPNCTYRRLPRQPEMRAFYCVALTFLATITIITQTNNCQTITSNSPTATKCNQLENNQRRPLDSQPEPQQHFHLHESSNLRARQPSSSSSRLYKSPNRSPKLANYMQAEPSAPVPTVVAAPLPLTAASNDNQPAPEEFSLALGGSSNQTASLANASGSDSTSYSLISDNKPAVPLEVPTTSTTTTSTSTSTSSPAPQPTTTTKEQVELAGNTTPSMAVESISSPPLSSQQPITTTTSSSNISPGSGRLSQASGRRMEDSVVVADGGHSSNSPNTAGSLQTPEQASAAFQPGNNHLISSAPSSMSIITPLMSPPQHGNHLQQQQQQQSSMIKPIYVLGNPIGEMEYNQQHSGRSEKRVDVHSLDGQMVGQFPNLMLDSQTQHALVSNITSNTNQQQQQQQLDDRMSGPALVYSGGHLNSVQPNATSLASTGSPNQPDIVQQVHQAAIGEQQQPPQQPLSPRLFQGPSMNPGASVLANTPRRPSLPPPVNQANAASGFRSPMSPSGPLLGGPSPSGQQTTSVSQPQLPPGGQQNLLGGPVNGLSLGGQSAANMGASLYQTSPPYAGGPTSSQALYSGAQLVSSTGQQQQLNKPNYLMSQQVAPVAPTASPTSMGTATPSSTSLASYQSRRPLNITRVEHISAECSNDLIRAVIVFNGTFKGIIYSSGYVNDPTCLYVNGTGSTRYEFSIRLNQCGTLGRQELHQPTIPGEARRRDQVMWNTLSIQYNSIIEQEWDEHFRVSCEYGSDFWKTVSFNPFNVETNTGSPVVFTINPPQCQMDVLLGHGMGPKIAVDGPVTVGDPLTLLIHMKSEKAGYDILVKNCVAHNGGKQRMQLIDSNGCVVNERFISPFRGTYNDNDLRHVTLYAYLKAFRFTGSPVLYLECEIHMCQSACPPQMCYWRRLSKRSVDNNDFEYTDDRSLAYTNNSSEQQQPLVSDSLSLFKALQVRHEPAEPEKARRRAQQMQEIYAEDDEAQLVCYRHAEVLLFMLTSGSLLLLMVSVAVTCCWRIRKLTRNQFEHNRLKGGCGSSTASSLSPSLSPSLLSINGQASAELAGPGPLLAIDAHLAPKPVLDANWHYEQKRRHLGAKANLSTTFAHQQFSPTARVSFPCNR